MDISKNIVEKKIGEIRPYSRNARKNSQTVNLLVKIIPKVGFNVPIVIDKNGVIVKGHARYMAAIRLGLETVPCIISNATEDNIKLDRIADNLVSEFSEWVTDDLLDELKEMDVDFDMTELSLPDFRNTALEDDETEAVVIEGNPDEYVPEEAAAPIKYYRCRCPKCGNLEFKKASEVEGENG